MLASTETPNTTPRAAGKRLVLIMSSDAVAAALVGALIETLGFGVRFHNPPEDPFEAFRRERPDVAMLDAADRLLISDPVLGRAAMRGIPVVVFGSREAMEKVGEIARTHQIQTLLTPITADGTSELLTQLFARRG